MYKYLSKSSKQNAFPSFCLAINTTMARTSLLLSLALVLVIASVSAHPPNPKKTQKNICPPTLGGIQTIPSNEISKFIEEKAKSAPNSVQFNALFSICKTFSNQLAALKAAGVRNVIRVAYTKYAMIAKAMFAAEAAIGIEGSFAAKLEKSYNVMAGCFLKLEEKIAEISAKYKFNANAMISQGDRDKIDECLINLKGAITVFVKEITECTMKFSSVKQIGIPLVRGSGGGLVGAFTKNGVGFGSKMIGLSGHSQAEAKVGVQSHVGGRRLFGGFFDHLGGFVKYDAAGKAKFRGDGEFKSRVHPSKKHLD
ncbi:hypothetical protein IGI04_033163 [Brassica rapa subsp. trilocularis]|uniref:Pectinesterase inhibitor domain-containing protein n=1 Tax=Brassica rapa subsp. trilocularis TaxID=1813537 RepID=A0ABQ7L565_BRACM|nr:hypothetical protein IGI04_033163 [Brassica rapa subsp. trilocularis]